MASHVDCEVAHHPTLFYSSILQGTSVDSCPGGTILCKSLLHSSCPLLKMIYSMTGLSMVICRIDQSQCFQIHVSV